MAKPLNTRYSRYRPRWFRARMPIFWWLRRLPFTKFIVRELTSVFVAYCAMLLLVQAWALARGPVVYAGFQAWLERPAVVVGHGVVLLMLLFHTVTWLNLAPMALGLRFRGRKVPNGTVMLAHYLGWLAASAVVVWILVER